MLFILRMNRNTQNYLSLWRCKWQLTPFKELKLTNSGRMSSYVHTYTYFTRCSHEVEMYIIQCQATSGEVKTSETVQRVLHELRSWSSQLLHRLLPEHGGTTVLRNDGNLSHHYTSSQPRRPRPEPSP